MKVITKLYLSEGTPAKDLSAFADTGRIDSEKILPKGTSAANRFADIDPRLFKLTIRHW